MNNIFKVIWNHATQTWTAVGELASAKGKSKSVKLAAISTALLAVVAGGVQAAEVVYKAEDRGGLAIGTTTVSDQFYGSADYTAKTGLSKNEAGAKVNAYDGIAIGNGALSGSNSGTAGNAHVAIGLMSQATGNTANGKVGDGANAQNAAVALGAYSLATGQGSTALGAHAVANELDSTAVGKVAQAKGQSSTAVGQQAQAIQRATATGAQSKALGTYSTAMGQSATANSWDSITVGSASTVSGANSINVGSNSVLSGTNIATVGANSKISSNNVSALGSNITVAAGRDGAVVLGHGSDAGADTTKVIAVNSTTAEGSPLVYSGFAGNLGGKDETGTNNKAASKQGNFVSVGSANGGERQIKHIAAGEITADSTDAINGSQLYRVAETLGKAANQTANALGVTLNKDGTLSGFSQPLTTAEGSNYTAPPAAGDVKTALTNLNNYVNAGWNITASGNNYEKNVSVGHTVNFVGTGNVDVDGSTIDGVRTVNISVDSPLDYASTTTTTPDGKTVNVAKASDGKWYPVDENGDIKENAQPVEASKIDKKGAKLTDSDTENHPYEKGNAYTYDDEGNITATGYDKTKPESKDKITAGKNGVQLNNVGWATQPDQAVNKDQLDQTVNKSGFYVQQNGKSTLDGKTSSDKVSDTEKVTPNDVVNFADGDGTVVKVKTERDENGVDTTTVSVDVDAKKVIDKVKGNVTAAKVDGDDAGKVTVADSDKGKLATVDTVKDAINSSFWTARVENNDKQVVKTADNSANATIKAGSNVAFVAGKNLVANQTTTGDNTVFTYGLADKIEVSKITVKPAAGEEDKGTTVENGKVTNLDDHLTAPAKVTGGNVVNATEVKTPILTDAEKKEAATVNDVLNAGWNLKTNGNQAAAITNGKGLDFASDDNSVTITPTVDKDGNAKVNFSVNATSVINNNKGSIKEAATDPKAANAGKVTVSDADKGKLATVDTVAKAINSAATFVKVADSQEVITTSTANDNGVAVKSGDTVTHTAGKNLKVKRDGQSVTYALAQDIDVDSVKAKNGVTIGSGDNATTITSDDKGLNLAGKNGAATNINNVKDADLNSTSKQAVNGSQLYATNEKVANLGTTVNNLSKVINHHAGAIDSLDRKVNKHSKQARAGIAGANAAAALPQAYTQGKAMVAAAAGTFKGQNALAVGYSRISDNGKVILKLQGNANTRGDVGAGVGVGYQW
ncbi:YadA-like family protein [Haemophilus parainfluenzae]|uniref:YadA-like family protein n=1 Tax=Haemophilus parainfluenzae TaxID=729 RepID=UPI00066A6A32|nr:YadA-like family protein [Haemophilus parainfluenzae]